MGLFDEQQMQNNNISALHKKVIKLTQSNFKLLESLSSHIMLSEDLSQNAQLQNFKELKCQYERIVRISQQSVARNEELENELSQKAKQAQDLENKIMQRNNKADNLQEQVEKASFTLKKERKKLNQRSKTAKQNQNLKAELQQLKHKRKQQMQADRVLVICVQQLQQKSLSQEREVDQMLFNRSAEQKREMSRINELEATLKRLQLDVQAIRSNKRPVQKGRDMRDNQKTTKMQDIQLMIKKQLDQDYQ